MRSMISETHPIRALLLGLVLFLGLFSPALAKMYRVPISFEKQAGDLVSVDLRVLPALDNGQLIAAAEGRAATLAAAPYEIAHPRLVEYDLDNSGTWETLADGSRLWRLRVVSPGSNHTSLGFSRFDLPAGASLWIYDPARDQVEGPYTAQHRSSRGRLYTPVVFGDAVIVELHVPAGAGDDLDVRLSRIHHGFRGFDSGANSNLNGGLHGGLNSGATKGFSGTCNNDVICPEGDPWRNQIRSVARYTRDGAFLCSGQLVNNTAEDDTPYFLSAFHCGVSANNDDTVVVYWNYESPACGQRDGGSLDNNQTGSTFRASEANTDFLLLELNQSPDPAYNVFFTGWDVGGATSQASVGIHHPSGDVKAISFNDDPLTTTAWIVPDTHWMVDNWEDGTTEGGSSGSCLWDPTSQLCVGVLTAGLASCQVLDFDIYGKLSLAWDVGADAASRLRDWLDPQGFGVTTLQGKDPGPTGGCSSTDTVLCLRNNRFQVEVTRVDDDGQSAARVVAASNNESGVFYFETADNWELLLKVLDGCAITDHYWVFAASATDVDCVITVTDTETGQSRQYQHTGGAPAPAITDTAALATCP